VPRGFDHSIVVRVPVRRLDDLAADIAGRISFVKIDVEGGELGVLRGATATIARHRPALLIEIEARHSLVPVTETFAFITDFGYQGSFIDAGRRRPLAEFDPAIHQRAADVDASDRYVNNFLFLPDPSAPTPGGGACGAYGGASG
jgi:hypothetical protein